MQVFGQSAGIAIAPAIYTFGGMFTDTVLARAWAVYGKKCTTDESV